MHGNVTGRMDSNAGLSPEDQLTELLSPKRLPPWTLEWNIPGNELTAAQKALKKLPIGRPSSAVVQLVPYLPPADGLSGIRRTFRDLWTIARMNYPKYRCDVLMDEHEAFDGLELIDGIEHEPGLRWEIIDLEVNLNADPIAVRNKRSPHAGIMAVAAFQPKVIASLSHRILLPGYDMRISDSIPCLFYNRDNSRIDLTALPLSSFREGKIVPSDGLGWTIPVII